MSLNLTSTAAMRREVVDRLRTSRELELALEADDQQVREVLEEIDLLEMVAGAADDLTRFPATRETAEAAAALRHALRRWKE
jgi:hypothetical protein